MSLGMNTTLTELQGDFGLIAVYLCVYVGRGGQGWKTAHSTMLDAALVCRETEGMDLHACTVHSHDTHFLMIIKPVSEVCQ